MSALSFPQGTPVFSLLTKNNCTVTLCHSRTTNLPEIVKTADILVVAIGSAEFVKGDWIKEGAVVIDVGTNAVEGMRHRRCFLIQPLVGTNTKTFFYFPRTQSMVAHNTANNHPSLFPFLGLSYNVI